MIDDLGQVIIQAVKRFYGHFYIALLFLLIKKTR